MKVIIIFANQEINMQESQKIELNDDYICEHNKKKKSSNNLWKWTFGAASIITIVCTYVFNNNDSSSTSSDHRQTSDHDNVDLSKTPKYRDDNQENNNINTPNNTENKNINTPKNNIICQQSTAITKTNTELCAISHPYFINVHTQDAIFNSFKCRMFILLPYNDQNSLITNPHLKIILKMLVCGVYITQHIIKKMKQFINKNIKKLMMMVRFLLIYIYLIMDIKYIVTNNETNTLLAMLLHFIRNYIINMFYIMQSFLIVPHHIITNNNETRIEDQNQENLHILRILNFIQYIISNMFYIIES